MRVQLGRCLLVLDELQAIAPKRGNDTTNENTFDRLLSCLLTEMDGIEYKNLPIGRQQAMASDVFVLGVTRNIDEIDPALLRPGRLDCKLKLEDPTSEEVAALLAWFGRAGGKGNAIEVGEAGLLPGTTRAHVKHYYTERCMAAIRASLGATA